MFSQFVSLIMILSLVILGISDEMSGAEPATIKKENNAQ